GAEAMTPLAPRAVRASSRLAAGERGVVLIQVALASLVLFGICSLVVDYGVMWVARAQAQNAAGAGSLAAATNLGFGAVAATTAPQQTAVAVASTTAVWGKRPVVPAEDVTICSAVSAVCPAITGLPRPQNRAAFGVTVSVYADTDHFNPLPTYFAPLFGI